MKIIFSYLWEITLLLSIETLRIIWDLIRKKMLFCSYNYFTLTISFWICISVFSEGRIPNAHIVNIESPQKKKKQKIKSWPSIRKVRKKTNNNIIIIADCCRVLVYARYVVSNNFILYIIFIKILLKKEESQN